MKHAKPVAERRNRWRRHRFHRPAFESLEDRVQPGSVIVGMGALESGAAFPDPLATADGGTDTAAIRRLVTDDLLPAQTPGSLSVIPESISIPLAPAAHAESDANTAAQSSSEPFDNSGASLAGIGLAGTLLGAGSSINAPALAAGIPAASAAGRIGGGIARAFAPLGSMTRLGVMPAAAAPLTPQEVPDQGAALGQESAITSSAANVTQPAQGQQPPLSSLLPLSFEANQGQADPHFQFLAHGPGYELSLSATDVRLSLGQPSPAGATPGALPAPAAGVTVDMQLLGANPSATAVGRDELPGKVNYIFGSDHSQWHTNIPTFGRVEFQNVYPGINLVYYTHQQQPEYDFVVAPGADPSVIRLALTGADHLGVDAQGDLLVQAGGLTVREHKPLVYQESDGLQQEIPSQFVVQGQQVTFQTGSYDPSRPLVIDPIILYYWIGGPGADGINDVKVDAGGNIYVTGYYEDVANDAIDAWVLKFNAAGVLVWDMVVNPFGLNSGNVADGRGLAIDAAGDVFVSGSALSPTFGEQTGLGFALDPNGNLAYSFTTGSGGEELVSVWADAAGNAYYTGWVVDRFTGANDALVAKVALDATVVYATSVFSLAGGDTLGLGIAADGAGNADVGGQIFNGTSNVGYIFQLNPAGDDFNWQGAYRSPSQAGGVTVDGANNIYVSGQRLGGRTGQHSLLLLKLNPLGGAIYDLLWRVGATLPGIIPRVAVDAAGNTYVSDTLVHHRRGTFGWVGIFSPAGNRLLGHGVLSNSAGFDAATGVALNNLAVPNVYVSGITNRTLFGGATDGFVAEFN